MKAYLFQPLLGSGIKKLPRTNLEILPFRELLLPDAKPADGTPDLSFE